MWAMDFPDLQEELAIATEAARAAGDEVLRMRKDGLRYGRKEGWELVSEADIRASEMLHDALAKRFPLDGWLGEEHADTAERLGRERVWVVDPIDGTREYLQGLPEFAVSVGLVVNGVPALGVVYNPAAERMTAACCLGAEERLPGRELAKYDVLIGRGEARWDDIPPLPGKARTIGVGSVAYRLALVATNTGDAAVTASGRSEWDVAAGIALCLAAGLRVTDIFGAPLRFNQQEPTVRGMIVAEPGLHERIRSHIARYIR